MNNHTNFTKGPWSNSGKVIGVVSDSDDQSNGMMLSICWIDKFDLADQCEANAALIACAPEMYEMLDKILCVYELDYDDTCKVLDLLAKARGEK